MKIIKNNSGTSLLEMVITIGMFSVIMLLVISIFQSITEGQRASISSQNIQESMRYALEMMSKEIRGAKKSDDVCADVDTAKYKIFNIETGEDSGPDLYFKNKNNECVYYYLLNDRLQIKKVNPETGALIADIPVTPSSVNVKNILFNVADDEIGAFHSIQPRVTMKMNIESRTSKEAHKQSTMLQTTISSRHYE